MTENIVLGEDANCIYQILKKENNISSKKILDYAVSPEFEAICTGCVSGDAFLRAIKKLEKHKNWKSMVMSNPHWEKVAIDGNY
ncbi:MAG: hypothetical protein ACTSPC_10280 [Candidatus Heimdallarchaeota archaeon]